MHHFLYLSYPSPSSAPLVPTSVTCHRRCLILGAMPTVLNLGVSLLSFNLCRSVVPTKHTHWPTSSLLNSQLARSVYPRIILSAVISVSVYIPLHTTPIPTPFVAFCCYFCCGPSRTRFYPLLLILLTWIWVIRFTCFLHSAGLRAFVRLYNNASPFCTFLMLCFTSQNKICCDMCAPMCKSVADLR
jgi:hypothetical protein